MVDFTVGELASVCGGVAYCSRSISKETALKRKVTRITTDTREASDIADDNKATLFIALKGERFDGNDFVGEMCGKNVGAVVCSIDAKSAEALLIDKCDCETALIIVEDTLKAYGKIAKAHARRFDVPTVAVTGSVGKTSTKEITAAVLSQKLNVLKTKANFNNEVGLPKTLLGLGAEHEAVVLEMGMRGLGQIEYLRSIAEPKICIITNIGVAHIELLGSRENILRAKLELGGGECKTLLLNGDDKLLSDTAAVSSVLAEYGNSPELIYFGFGENCAYRAVDVVENEKGSEFTLVTPVGRCRTTLPIIGRHHVLNALAAAAAGTLLGLTIDDIDEGIRRADRGGMIRQLIEDIDNGITLIDDTYNAGPESMKASLAVLKELGERKKGARTVAILGDMLELGAVSENAHYAVGKTAAECGVSLLITVGELSKRIALGFDETPSQNSFIKNIVNCANSKEAAKLLPTLLKKNDVVLVKGSNAMKMKYAAEAVRELKI